jgi:hypothetical protein
MRATPKRIFAACSVLFLCLAFILPLVFGFSPWSIVILLIAILGLAIRSLFWAIAGTRIGKVRPACGIHLELFYIYRAEEPKDFWFHISVHFLLSIIMLGGFLYCCRGVLLKLGY